MLLNCGVGEDLRVPWTARRSNQSILKRSVLGVPWKDWCWCWNSNTLATWCEELTHLKRPWCWERLKAGGKGDDRGWDDWMASPARLTWVWVDSGSWWWTGRPGVLWFMGSQRVRHDWRLNRTELNPWTQDVFLSVSSFISLFNVFLKFMFIYLAASGLSCGIFPCIIQDLLLQHPDSSCDKWALECLS